MAKSTKNNLKALCADLAQIGMEATPPRYDEAMRAEGWLSSRDAGEAMKCTPDAALKVLNKAVEEGLWERQRAGNARQVLWAFRKLS